MNWLKNLKGLFNRSNGEKNVREWVEIDYIFRGIIMEVLIEEICWTEPIDIYEGTITFSIEGTRYDAFSFGYDYEVGSLVDVEFSHISGDNPWEEIFNNNPRENMCLVKINGWSYNGYGKIVSINPVIANFGHISLDLGDWTNDVRVIGEYIYWKILRLDIHPINNGTDLK